jgi:hypothetical protein
MAVLVISYSRADQAQVRALVALLKGGLRNVEKAIYWDDQFEPGEPWFEQLKTHIDASPQLFVFWCDHSRASEQVRREFTYALERQKRVVPVLLDDTPLAPELAPIHGIDLRGAVRHTAGSAPGSVPPPAASSMGRTLLTLAASLVLLVGVAGWWALRSGGDEAGPAGAGSVAVSPAPGDVSGVAGGVGAGGTDGGGSGGVNGRGPLTRPLPRPVPVEIQGRGIATTSTPVEAVLTPDTRARIDAMIRQVPSAAASRVVINARAGRGLDVQAARRQSEAIQQYIARQHAIPIERIEIEEAPALDARGSTAPQVASTTISIEPAAPVTGPDPSDSGVGGSGQVEMRPTRMPAVALLAVAGAVAALLFAALRRNLGERRRRKHIVSEFERHLGDQLPS